jgi:hypothetical protein
VAAQLLCVGTCGEARCCVAVKWTDPCILAGAGSLVGCWQCLYGGKIALILASEQEEGGEWKC